MSDNSILVKDIKYLITMDEQHNIYRQGAVYIEGNSIVAVGPNKTVDYKADMVIDGKGKLVLPGLVNTHHHLYQTLTRAFQGVQNAGLFDWLKVMYEVWREYTPEALSTSARVGIAELLLSGCTTTNDMFYIYLCPEGSDAIELFDVHVKAAKELGIRFHPAHGSMSRGRREGGLPPDDLVQPEAEILGNSRRIIRRYHDPSARSMCRLVLAPCSPFSVTTELLEATRALAVKHRVHCHTHLAETLDEVRYCMNTHGKRPLAYLEDAGWRGEDVWFAHAVYLDDAEIKRLSATGTGVAYCARSNMRLGQAIAPIVDMVNAGVNVSIAVDGSASNDSSNMLNELRTGALLQRVKYGADNALTPYQILELATIGGAKVLGRDDIGVIEPGKTADLICIDANWIGYAGALDPVAMPVLCDSPQVHTSIINGKLVVENGKVSGVDLPALVAKQDELARGLVESVRTKTHV